MTITLRDARAEDFPRCVEIRGMTRDNPIPEDVLRGLGITEDSWTAGMASGSIIGVVAETSSGVVGFCNGDTDNGEILVLALLPDYEGRGIGKQMLSSVSAKLFDLGFSRLWLAASPDSGIRAHGFYRHLGWTPTGERNSSGDEVLEYSKSN